MPTRFPKLLQLDHLRSRHGQLRAKYPVPKSTRNTKAILVIRKMMLKVIFFQLTIIRGQIPVMQEVMRQVVADVSKDTTTVYCCSCAPAVGEYKVRQIPERCRERYKKRWRHDQAKFVHREVVMNGVEQEM